LRHRQIMIDNSARFHPAEVPMRTPVLDILKVLCVTAAVGIAPALALRA